MALTILSITHILNYISMSSMMRHDTCRQWRADWLSAYMSNHIAVTDSTIGQPGFDLFRRVWYLLNYFQASQGPCVANLH